MKVSPIFSLSWGQTRREAPPLTNTLPNRNKNFSPISIAVNQLSLLLQLFSVALVHFSDPNWILRNSIFTSLCHLCRSKSSFSLLWNKFQMHWVHPRKWLCTILSDLTSCLCHVGQNWFFISGIVWHPRTLWHYLVVFTHKKKIAEPVVITCQVYFYTFAKRLFFFFPQANLNSWREMWHPWYGCWRPSRYQKNRCYLLS